MDDIILTATQAIDYLEDIAQQHVREIMDGNEDSEGLTELIEDLYTMKKQIQEEGNDWYKISECPMSASQLKITPMIEKEN